ncbi:hypothetical protein K490DRAFT_65025 [Saccharata proteae CBS 121410]|uniref:Something about silencing protein 4 domain-containing protein n=1 Tax=Saccharata proteae CBS 121410 TaxID=1314787 RepID=A0A9P4LY27_9PEZI|nr:hypothetical protein K490DRAFT_65025 [Saccharata proteae CBS 121410]
MVSSSRPLPRSSSGRFTRRPQNKKTQQSATATTATDGSTTTRERSQQRLHAPPPPGQHTLDHYLLSHHNHAKTARNAPIAQSQDALTSPTATTGAPPPPTSNTATEAQQQQPPQKQRLKLLGPSTANRGTVAAEDSSAVSSTLSSSSSRKKGAAARGSSTAQPKPPTKITVTHPHGGGLVQTVNGVRTELGEGREGNATTMAARGKGEEDARLAVPGGDAGAGAASAQKTDKRSLRSQDGGSRLKSDLAIYFPNYDEVISGVPKKPDFLDIDAPIYIADEPVATPPRPPPSATTTIASPTSSKRRRLSSASKPTHALPNGHHTITTNNTTHPPTPTPLDLTTLIPTTDPTADPLPDAHFFAPHRRAERKEKQLRNIEKERAMHEKVQLERLLDGLLGHDWLRVMGITGVTDSEKREWGPRREYFVKEVRALVDKFRVWKEEEKRLREGRGRAAAAAREEADSASPAPEGEEGEGDDDHTPPSEDVDAWAARQLRLEAEHSASSASRKRKRKPGTTATPSQLQQHQHLLYRPPSPEKPFTSFYAKKPHLRAAAVAGGRWRTATGLDRQGGDTEVKEEGGVGDGPAGDGPAAGGPEAGGPAAGGPAAGGATAPGAGIVTGTIESLRSRTAPTAFGHPVPDGKTVEFKLPPEYLTADALRAHARKRRRLRRETKPGR